MRFEINIPQIVATVRGKFSKKGKTGKGASKPLSNGKK